MPVELIDDHLEFRFPEIHEDAFLRIAFQRTLRVPDDGREHWLPPGLGAFPLREISNFGVRVPASWRERGGVVLPMWQAEACWLSFQSSTGYPMAVKVAAGMVNALTGKPWQDALDHAEQDFMEVPTQPWLDGFCVAKGVVRQFVAMPLGGGYTAEEQLTGAAEFGGIQLLVRPLKAEVWNARAEERDEVRLLEDGQSGDLCYSVSEGIGAMGLAPGGSIRQEIAEASELPTDWASMHTGERCFVQLVNSAAWHTLAGDAPPTEAPSAADYTNAGLPWFDWYSDSPAIGGSESLAGIKTVLEHGAAKGEQPLDGNQSFIPPTPVVLGKTNPPLESDHAVDQ